MKVRIKELGRIVTGTTPKTSIKDYYSSNDYMFIGPSDLQNGKYIRKTEKHISTTAYSDYKSRFLNVGDICVSCIGYVGYIAKPTQLSLSNQQINSITQINENIVISDYLFYKLLSMNDYFQSINGNGSAVPIINKTIFENIEIDIHTLAEQQHIVDILGSIDEKIENNEQEIRKINDLALCFIAKSNNLNTELKPYIKFIKGKKPIENGSTTAPYLSIDAITSFRYESVYSDDMIMATPFDILMVMDGASSGTVFSHQAGVVSSTIAKIDCSDNIKDYLYWYLLSLKEIIKSRNTGSAIPHANKEYISSLKFDYGFATDIKTINILHSLRTRIIQLQEENKKLQELKGLYLKKFFE